MNGLLVLFGGTRVLQSLNAFAELLLLLSKCTNLRLPLVGNLRNQIAIVQGSG